VLAGASTVGAGIVEDVVLEDTRIIHHYAGEGESEACPAHIGAANEDAVVIEIVGAYVVEDAIDGDT
jgi:hypothetical protein